MWISQAEREYREGQEAAWRRYKLWKKGKKKKGHRPKKKQIDRERNQAAGRCRNYLKEFWPQFSICSTKAERMELIKRAVKLNWWVSEGLRMKLRRQYLKFCKGLLRVPIETCGICESARPRERHHIVMIAYGGLNVDENLLAICTGCHDEIHPWMRGG